MKENDQRIIAERRDGTENTAGKEIDQMSLPELRMLAIETDSIEVLWKIMENCKGDAHTIQKIIENPLTRFDFKLVRIAYEQGDSRVQATIARHTADEELIIKSAEANNREIRCATALNPNIPMMTFVKLTHDYLWVVRASALSNKKINKYILEDMSDDDNFTVRNIARRMLSEMRNSK